MRVFAVSDVHVGHAENLAWILSLDHKELTNGILILAGDVTDQMRRITQFYLPYVNSNIKSN